jgi:O-antigen/teichoic acid export membrane protein
MLLAGRMISLVTNFVVQILTVRYLTKSDYGAFAWALSITSLGASLVVFGMDKTITRFAPIYQKYQHLEKLFGAFIVMVGTILALGLALILLIYGWRDYFFASYINNEKGFMLLLILIFVSPIQALDEFFVGMFAVFSKPKAIFFRKHLLAPGLKLCAVLLVILIHGNVYFLAKSYFAAGFIGLVINISILARILYKQEIFFGVKLHAIKMPLREIFCFAIPLLSSVMARSLRSSMVVVLIEYFHSASEVAAFRSVYPVARLNLIVLQSFAYLFTPLAASMFAQKDRNGISYLYQKSAVWITVFSFPIFIISFSLAQHVTVLLFGPRYINSGLIMAILAVGFYFSVGMGFNDLTLRVFGKVGKLFVVDIITIIISLGVCFWLIPQYGAAGAAIAASSSLIIQNLLNVITLRYCTGIKLFPLSSIKVFITIIAGTVGLIFIQIKFKPPIFIGIFISLLIFLTVFKINQKVMNIAQIFPEIRRFPILNWILRN